MKNLNKIAEVAESLGWNFTQSGTYVCFQKYSPEGQDFSVEIESKDAFDIIEEVRERFQSYDASYETYIWLDSTGHGTNGAPYDMKDLYEDMEACERMLEELADVLEELDFEDEEEDEDEE